MGQIIGGAAKPKRCNLNKLSQLETPAAGEYILVSSDNSMNAAGQGNFDCYIVGDGTTAAAALELKNVEPLIGVFDISSYHATGGVLAKYADLTAALDGGNNIPRSFRKGGMSVKFVQSSDNKYVQYRLMANTWSIDTNDWIIYEGVYVKNPDFVRVVTDNEDNILYGVKADGSFYFGAGVPQQVKDYIEEKISSLPLDEHNDMVAFLDDYLGSDTTLKAIIDGINATKVDKEEGKSLIDSEYASTKSNIENPEYLTVWVDQNDKVVFGLRTDGKTYIGDANFFNDIKNNQEAIAETNTTLATIGAKVDSLDIDALSSITTTENPEYIEAKLDSEDKIVEATKVDGTKVIGGNLEIGGGMKIGGKVTFISGIPQEIIDYVEANTGSGVSDIEYEDETGDMYATYNDADGVTDVYMDENGDIYAEIEE